MFSLSSIVSVIILIKIVFFLFAHHLIKKQKKLIIQSDKKLTQSYCVENNEVNTLILQIISKSKYLLEHVELDSQDKYIAEKSASSYMPRIIDTYKNINPILLNIKNDNQNSAQEMTVDQLKLIISGLKEIEMKLLTDKNDNTKVSEKKINKVFYK